MIAARLLLASLLALGLGACATTRTNNLNVSLTKASEYNAQLGMGYLQRGMLDQAKLKLEKAIDQDPSNAVAVSGYGMLMARLKQPQEAERRFRRAIELAPENSEIRNNYGTFLCEQQRIDEARQKFLEAADNPLYKTPEYALGNLGTCLTQAGRIKEAELQYVAALQANATFAPALYRMAEINLDKQAPDIAATYIERYHRAARQSPESLWLGIRIYRLLEDRGQLATYALRLKRRFPDSREAALLAETENND